MNSSIEHPDTETLDQLRAGLLDDDPARKEQLLAHVNTCDQCRPEWMRWQKIAELSGGLAPSEQERMIRQALDTPPRRQHHWLPAMAAAVTLAVGIGLWMGGQEINSGGEQIAQQQMSPAVDEDLDFYLWLAEQPDEQTSGLEPGQLKQRSPLA